MAAGREALELITFSFSSLAGAVGITLPEGGEADEPVELAEVGFVLAVAAGA